MFEHNFAPPAPLDTSHIKRKWLDLPYATRSPAQKLDLYLPDDGEGPFPVIATFHGGAWMFGDKADVMNLPFLTGLQRGYAVACVNYRLSGEAQFPSQIYDCKAAIRYLRGHAAEYKLDRSHIGVWGASAGGHLAALLGTSNKVNGLEDLSMKNSHTRISSKVQAVAVWYGPNENFLKMDEQLSKSGLGAPDHSNADSPESRLLGRKIAEIPALVEFASPMTHIKADVPPFLIQHGQKDGTVPVEQAIHFAAKLGQVAGRDKAILEILPEADHADPLFHTPENLQRVLDFFDSHLK
jgi:acetyl esterase/lipase